MVTIKLTNISLKSKNRFRHNQNTTIWVPNMYNDISENDVVRYIKKLKHIYINNNSYIKIK